MPDLSGRVYYEFAAGRYYLCLSGNMQSFHSLETLKSYVAGIYPEAELEAVTDDNWDELYESGAFDA